MSVSPIPRPLVDALALADPSWHNALRAGLEAMARRDPSYLPQLVSTDYLPTGGRIFAAFAQPLPRVRYVLFGEGPYPRAASAIGLCFMDGAVDELWSPRGLATTVNRATSLRNFMKMLLVADGCLDPKNTSGAALVPVARIATAPDSGWIQTRSDLQRNLLENGFLLLNATLVFRPNVAPLFDALAWQPLMQAVLTALAESAAQRHYAAPTLVLWGKIAAQLYALAISRTFPQVASEHPYNLTFIVNPAMQQLFGPMHLLQRRSSASTTMDDVKEKAG